MVQPVVPRYSIPEDARQSDKTPSMVVLAGAGLGGLAAMATLALWFHYGTQVFFETLRAGFAACF